MGFRLVALLAETAKRTSAGLDREGLYDGTSHPPINPTNKIRDCFCLRQRCEKLEDCIRVPFQLWRANTVFKVSTARIGYACA